jgi:hypothetical protein
MNENWTNISASSREPRSKPITLSLPPICRNCFLPIFPVSECVCGLNQPLTYSMTFLPDGYKSVPQSNGRYMKLQDGPNKIRILSSAIVGFEYWNTGGKPVRSKDRPQGIPSDIRYDDKGQPEKIKHFWAFVVWDYREKAVKVLELTQIRIMNSIKALVDNQDWGDPKQFDLTITRSGEGLNTDYLVQPSPHKDLPLEIANASASESVRLEALYEGGDPFASKEEQVNPDDVKID